MSPIRWLSRPPLFTDAAFALAVGVVTIAGSIAAGRDQTDMTPIDSVAYAILVIGALALAARRELPYLALAVTFACTVAWIYLAYPYGPIFFYVMIAIYSVAAWCRTRYAVIAVVPMLVAHIPWSLWGEADPDSVTFAAVTTSLWLICPLAMGIAVRTQRQAIARAMEQDRARHVYEERLRLAQEVHDVVGHSLAVISMNAGAALHVLTKQPGPERVAESLRAIRTASSGALDELRSALLRGDGRGEGAWAQSGRPAEPARGHPCRRAHHRADRHRGSGRHSVQRGPHRVPDSAGVADQRRAPRRGETGLCRRRLPARAG